MKSKPEKGNAPGCRSPEASGVKNQSLTKGINVSNSTQVNANRAITVPFHGAELYVVEHNGQPYTPMKPIVDGMGLAWQAQHRKVSANESRWGVVIITTPESNLHHHHDDAGLDGDDEHAGQRRAMTMLPLRKLPGWLATIDPGRVKSPEVRAKVIQYQNECDDALWKYWNDGVAVNARAAQPVQASFDYDRISPAQAQDLKQIVQAIVDAGIQKYAETWARLQRKFKVHSYLALHPDQYEEARAYLIAKLPSGFSSNAVDEQPTQTFIAPDHKLAFAMATQAAAYVQREVFNSVMTGTADGQSGRYLLSFNADSASQDADIHAQPVEREAVVLPIDRMHEAIEASSGMSAMALTQLASACMVKLSQLAQNAAAPSSNTIEALA